jgi:hypothetical protein
LTLEAMVDGMVEIFRADNPRFDELRFRKACNGD